MYERANIGKTFLFIDLEKLNKGKTEIIAYFTISQISLDISKISNKRRKKILGNYPGRDSISSISAYLIGQLGRNDYYTNDDLGGEQILKECYNSISIAARVVWGEVIVSECREQMFSKFYERQGYKKFYPDLNDKDLYTLYKRVNFNEYWNITN